MDLHVLLPIPVRLGYALEFQICKMRFIVQTENDLSMSIARGIK